MTRDPTSHKGENGKVMIIGGSRFIHGAPIFSALAAEAGGAALIYLVVPACHEETAKNASLNFQVYPFKDNEIQKFDLRNILAVLATMDSAVIGPGLDRSLEGQKIIRELIESCPCTMVLDASALQPWTLDAVKGKTAVLTPHLGELERMGVASESLQKAAEKFGCVLLRKGVIDRVAAPDGRLEEITGGNAWLTVGGTGDALAGLTAGLIAQNMDPFDACVLASRTMKRAGTVLRSHYRTVDVARIIPELLKN